MYTASELFTSASKSSVESLLTASNAAFSGFERLTALNLRVAQSNMEKATEAWKSLLSAKDSKDLTAGSSTAPAIETVVAYTRGVYEIVSETGAALFTEVEHNVSGFQKEAVETIDKAIESAPEGAKPGLVAVKAAITNVASACESMTKAAKKATESVHANITAATDSSLDTVGAKTPTPAIARSKAA